MLNRAKVFSRFYHYYRLIGGLCLILIGLYTLLYQSPLILNMSPFSASNINYKPGGEIKLIQISGCLFLAIGSFYVVSGLLRRRPKAKTVEETEES